MTHRSWREESRKDYGTCDAQPSDQSIGIGALLRIADAVEKMSGSYAAVIAERDRYKLSSEERLRWLQSEQRRTAALRGVITRIKNRARRTKR